MDYCFIAEKLIVKKSPIHGYGVFTIGAIKKGEVIEKSIKLIVPKDSCPPLFDYCVATKFGDAIMLGYLSIYNHSDEPNVRIEGNHTDIAVVIAIRDIEFGEEICWNYGGNYWDGRKNMKK